MSEKAPKSPEHRRHERVEKHSERLRQRPEKEPRHERERRKHEARRSVEKEALASKEHRPRTHEKASEPMHLTKSLKRQTYKKTMRHVRRELPGYQRVFSRVVHNQTVEAVSNVAGRSIARPSGLIGGGVAAFTGLLVVIYFARRNGFTLSGSEFILLLVIGWLFGIGVEVLWRFVRFLNARP